MANDSNATSPATFDKRTRALAIIRITSSAAFASVVLAVLVIAVVMSL